MIDGVKIKKLVAHRDIPDTPEIQAAEPGFLVEVVRDDDNLLSRFGQSTFTIAPAGTIKAFHWHKQQDDLWFIATGKARIVLFDRREDSPTKGETQAILAGKDDYKIVLIPAGVAHGYQVLGDQPVALFYHTSKSYDAKNPDEQRIAYNDPEINFNWDGKDI